MRVFISVDIEGITGLVSWSQCSRPDGKSFDYAFARKMMAHDVNAAIRGAARAGATSFTVKDSHGNSKNLLVEDLDPRATLISGYGCGHDGMMQGIDSSYAAAMLIGYHAKAGTVHACMEHTITGGIHRLRINGSEVGEMGLSTAAAGEYGVPMVTVTSDQAGVVESATLIQGVQTVAVKQSLGRFMSDMLHPEVTEKLIEEAAYQGVMNRQNVQPVRWGGPLNVSLEFNRSEEADMAMKFPEMTRLDGYTVGGTYATYPEAHLAIWNLVNHSFQGISAQW